MTVMIFRRVVGIHRGVPRVFRLALFAGHVTKVLEPHVQLAGFAGETGRHVAAVKVAAVATGSEVQPIDGLPVKPEMDKLSSADTLCVYGDDDEESICPKVSAQHARVIKLPGGHHFGGNYVPLAQLVIGAEVQSH